MNVPLIDPRTREDIIAEIKALALERVPEWCFDPDNPDAGAMLALIWADMLYGTIRRFNRAAENYKINLYNSLNLQPRPALPSRGFLSFEASDNTVVPDGFKAAAGDKIFATTRDLYATVSKITEVYSVSENACRLCGEAEDVYLFDRRGENPVTWFIEHPYAFNVSYGGTIGFMADSRGISALNDPEQASWEFSDTEMRLNILNKAAFEGVSIRNIGLLPRNSNLLADAVYTNDMQMPPEGFFPFGERFSICDEVYFACDEALEKHGAAIRMNLGVKMERFPIEGYPLPEPSYKPVMKLRDLNIPETFEIFISEITWEYFNGTGWAALTTTPHRDIFYSTDRVEQEIEFICPDDFDSITVGAHEKRYVRARIMQVENAFKMYGCYWSPFIETLRFSYEYDKPLPPSRVSSYQNLEKTLWPEMVIDNKFREPSVYLSVDNPSARGSVLAELDECGGAAELRWEYHAENGWNRLDVEDGTLGLSRTGLISYIAAVPWAQLPVFGKLSHWIRVTYAGVGKPPMPKLIRVWNNAVTAECGDGGTESNVEANQIVKLMQAAPGVEAVTNPLPMEGGSADEYYESAVRRFMTGRRVTVC